MTAKRDSKAELRSANFNPGLSRANYHLPKGSIGVFMQVTLAILYMYLLFAGFMMLGTEGLVLVSSLFLVALFSPIIYRAISSLRKRRKTETNLLQQEFKTEAGQKS